MLLTCIGRRVELLRAFEKAGDSLGIRLEIHGADATPLAPAIQLVDHPHIVPEIESGKYIDALADVVQREKIDMLIPLIDSELPVIAAAAERFVGLGCVALISSASVVAVCRDKLATYRKLTEAGIDTPATSLWIAAVEQKRHRFPYFLKPRFGSAAMGNYVVRTIDELQTFGARVKNAIVQEFVEGAEHTLDVYVDFEGRVRCVVPRKRLEVRTGEVSKGLIVKDPAIMAVGHRV
ncbi:MAG: ATP-grasp domain-containing protein, partial [Tepidisphaeraceae bacterium]